MSDSRVSGKRASSASKSDAKPATEFSNTMSSKDLDILDLPPETNLQTLDTTKTVNQVSYNNVEHN